MSSSPRRRLVFAGSLAALVAALAVFGGVGYGATGVTRVSKPVSAQPPTPASDQYGKPPKFVTKCAQKANASYKTGVAKAQKVLLARLAKAKTDAARLAAVNAYEKALAGAKATQKTSLKKCTA